MCHGTLWRSESNQFTESVPSFHHVFPWDPTWAIRFGGKGLSRLSNLEGPICIFIIANLTGQKQRLALLYWFAFICILVRLSVFSMLAVHFTCFFNCLTYVSTFPLCFLSWTHTNTTLIENTMPRGQCRKLPLFRFEFKNLEPLLPGCLWCVVGVGVVLAAFLLTQVLVHSPVWPWDPPASAAWVLGFQACTSVPQ